jgi:uncharacterized protein
VLRYAEVRLDASTLQELPDGSIKVVGQLTHPGIFNYRNPDGSLRREYRPADEVFRKAALESFAGAPVTVNHPRQPNGQRLVTPQSWKKDAIGHAGENVREDGGHAVADLYIRDADAVAAVKGGRLKKISLGYNVEYDPTPGTTSDGQRYDGIQRNIRGNHIALLPTGIAPRGGEECALRLDSNGDELKSDVEDEALKAKVAALESELSRVRADAAELPKKMAELSAANARIAELSEQLKPARLDSLVEARSVVVALAKSAGVDSTGKSSLDVKRAIVAKRTPELASRVDSMGEEAVDAVMAVYAAQPAHVGAPLAVLAPPAPAARADATDDAPVPKYADLYRKHAEKSRNAWKNSGEKVN